MDIDNLIPSISIFREDLQYGLVEAEPVPLTYSTMRDKILDATSIGSKSPTSISGEDFKFADNEED